MKLFAEKRRTFPDPRQSLEEGIVEVSDNVNVDRLLEAYSFGIFPWPHEAFPVLWFSPPFRGVIDFEQLHVSRSLSKFLKRTNYLVTFNQAFEQVIEGCSAVPRPGQDGSWITPLLKRAYIDFHRAGYAHSVECWSDGKLVGGLYGVYVAGVFCGESMFHYKDNASKFCLLELIKVLKREGLNWMDIQMVTPHLERMGGKYIPREVFLWRLEEAKKAARLISLNLESY